MGCARSHAPVWYDCFGLCRVRRKTPVTKNHSCVNSEHNTSSKKWCEWLGVIRCKIVDQAFHKNGLQFIDFLSDSR